MDYDCAGLLVCVMNLCPKSCAGSSECPAAGRFTAESGCIRQGDGGFCLPLCANDAYCENSFASNARCELVAPVECDGLPAEEQAICGTSPVCVTGADSAPGVGADGPSGDGGSGGSDQGGAAGSSFSEGGSGGY